MKNLPQCPIFIYLRSVAPCFFVKEDEQHEQRQLPSFYGEYFNYFKSHDIIRSLFETVASMKHYKRLVVLLLTPIHRQQKKQLSGPMKHPPKTKLQHQSWAVLFWQLESSIFAGLNFYPLPQPHVPFSPAESEPARMPSASSARKGPGIRPFQ